MSLGEAVILAAGVLTAMFGMLFGLAAVEEGMFASVTTEAETETAEVPTPVLDAVTEVEPLRQVA